VGKITELRTRGKKVELCIDGTLSFSVSVALANRMRLSPGQVLSAEEINHLMETETTERCFDAALRLLKYRPRSRVELKQRLIRHGFCEMSVDKVLKALEERGLIDDRAFAQYWKDNRVRFKPKSARLIRLELKQVGISPELAGAVTELLDEESLAYDAAVRKARVLRSCSEEEFSKRLYNHLQRRGFADAVIRSVLRRLAEVHNANDE